MQEIEISDKDNLLTDRIFFMHISDYQKVSDKYYFVNTVLYYLANAKRLQILTSAWLILPVLHVFSLTCEIQRITRYSNNMEK